MNETVNDWAFGLGIASALSTLGIIGYSRLAAKGAGKAASIGTQTDSAASLSGPRVIAREGDVFFGRRFGTAPGRLWRKVTTPFNNNISTQTVATGIGVDAGTQFSPTMLSDAATSMSPPQSIRSTAPTASSASTASTASTASSRSIGATQLETRFTPPPPNKVSPGSILGFERDPVTGKWVATNRSSYRPPR